METILGPVHRSVHLPVCSPTGDAAESCVVWTAGQDGALAGEKGHFGGESHHLPDGLQMCPCNSYIAVILAHWFESVSVAIVIQ